MGTFALASLVIGLFGTIGAMHMLRNLAPTFFGKGKEGDEPGEAGVDAESAAAVGIAPPSIGGLAMVIGIAIASFYMDPWPYSAQGLVYASMFLVLAGLWLERRGSLEARPLLMVLCGIGGTLLRRRWAVAPRAECHHDDTLRSHFVEELAIAEVAGDAAAVAPQHHGQSALESGGAVQRVCG